MPMDAWRDGDTFHVEFDLPGVDPDSIDLDVERNVVTVRAERPARASDAELIAAERPRGCVQPAVDPGRQPRHRADRRRLRGGGADSTIPVAERAKPRRISITRESDDSHAINA